MCANEAPIEIAAYDPSWPARFEEERERLLAAIGGWLAGPIEHIGSTAVRGMPAKPVIDIMAGVQTLDASRPAIVAVADLGYCYSPYRPDAEHWFCKPSLAVRTHHLHLVPCGSALWAETLAFRDHLRAHPTIAAEYATLKLRLARKYRFDREAYTEAKGPFVARIVGIAQQQSRWKPPAGQ
jgi:GrpB-like predicted nucleotidyltransferase (UPF0157 family)